MFAAIGVVIFAINVNTSMEQIDSQPAAFLAPTQVSVELTPSGRNQLKTKLGVNCVTHLIRAVAISENEKGVLDLILDAQSGCNWPRVFMLEPGSGQVSPQMSDERSWPDLPGYDHCSRIPNDICSRG